MPRRPGPMVAVPGEQHEFAPAHRMMGVHPGRRRRGCTDVYPKEAHK